jgi:hypothetical protein
MDETVRLAEPELPDTLAAPPDAGTLEPERAEWPVDCLLTTMAATRATSFAIASGQCPSLDIDGTPACVGAKPLDVDGFERLIQELLPRDRREQLAATGSAEHELLHQLDGMASERFVLRAVRSADAFSMTVTRVTADAAREIEALPQSVGRELPKEALAQFRSLEAEAAFAEESQTEIAPLAGGAFQLVFRSCPYGPLCNGALRERQSRGALDKTSLPCLRSESYTAALSLLTGAERSYRLVQVAPGARCQSEILPPSHEGKTLESR